MLFAMMLDKRGHKHIRVVTTKVSPTDAAKIELNLTQRGDSGGGDVQLSLESKLWLAIGDKLRNFARQFGSNDPMIRY